MDNVTLDIFKNCSNNLYLFPEQSILTLVVKYFKFINNYMSQCISPDFSTYSFRTKKLVYTDRPTDQATYRSSQPELKKQSFIVP